MVATSTNDEWSVNVKHHPGSSQQDIDDEPDWGSTRHEHFTGYKNSRGRRPGLTHGGDEREDDEEAFEAFEEFKKAKEDVKEGHLMTFADAVHSEKDLSLKHPEHRPLGWRFLVEFSEKEIKEQPKWPANVKKRKAEEEQKKKEDEEKNQKNGDKSEDQKDGDDKKQKSNDQNGNEDKAEKKDDKSKDQKKGDSQSQSNGQPGDGKSQKSDDKDDKKDSETQDPKDANKSKQTDGQGKKDDSKQDSDNKDDKSQQSKDKSSDDKDGDGEDDGDDDDKQLSPQEAALLAAVKHEQKYMTKLQVNDGSRHSHVKNRTSTTIDEADETTPDNWIPRSSELIRLTGKHPVNAEAPLHRLFESGFITPNELHYVRNHGAVPRILWELHKVALSFEGKSAEYTMKDLSEFKSYNLPVLIACDGNRRKELNMLKRSTGFDWGPGGIGCAYWKGPFLRDVILDADILPKDITTHRYYIHFRGADNPNNVHYETSIPLEYVMDATNDVLLAYEMNDVPLPPDHGYPLRVVIPGYVGARQVKWLKEIWISDKENDSYFHIHDNRFLPSFVTDSNSEIAKFLFHHPDTAIYEQSLQSVIALPAHGERMDLKDVRKGQKYRIKGFAYNGRGDQVQRVEVSLDEGKSWLYCIRTFPEAPIRHGKKFWTWCFWHVDVCMVDLIRAPGIIVRAHDVKKMTQPEKPVWTLSGMMNNSQYVVKPVMEDGDIPHITFRHPVEPADGDGGWMKNSPENQLKEAERKPDAPKKQFTRAEIEKHDTEQDCWIVIDGCVYDATSVLGWHPGGGAAIMSHAGAVHQETTSEFASIHDEYAHQKLNECILGVVTDKAKKYIAKTAEEAKKGDQGVPDDQALMKHRWLSVKLIERKPISDDTEIYRFQLPKGKDYLGIGTCQHVEFGFHLKDKMLTRAYTPIKPVLPRDCKPGREIKDKELHDGTGIFDLVVKTYFANDEQPGGAMSNILHEVEIGEHLEIRGPTGDIIYEGNGQFQIYGEKRIFKRVSLVLGGTGLTPGYSLIARSCLTDDKTEIRIIDANKSEADILLREQLDEYTKGAGDRVQITHVLSHPSDDWDGLKGHVNEDIIKEHLFPPDKDSLVLLCGPPGMIQKAALPALQDWGYEHDKNMFGL